MLDKTRVLRWHEGEHGQEMVPSQLALHLAKEPIVQPKAGENLSRTEH